MIFGDCGVEGSLGNVPSNALPVEAPEHAMEPRIEGTIDCMRFGSGAIPQITSIHARNVVLWTTGRRLWGYEYHNIAMFVYRLCIGSLRRHGHEEKLMLSAKAP